MVRTPALQRNRKSRLSAGSRTANAADAATASATVTGLVISPYAEHELARLPKRTAFFYRDLRPDLDVETITTYFAEHLDGPSQFLILAEDITLRGAEVPDAVDGLSVEQVDELS